MYGYIYKTTDKKHNKIYIGQHHSNTFEGYGYIGSGRVVTDIRNYCIKNNIPLEERFNIELLEECETKEQLNIQECYWIEKFNSNNPDIGYNLTYGGDGGDTVQGRVKITNGVHDTYSYPEDIPEGWYIGTCNQGSNHPLYGRTFTWVNNGLEELQLGSEQEIPEGYVIGRLPMSNEQRDLISQARKGVNNLSQEFIEEMRQRFLNNNPVVPKYGDDNVSRRPDVLKKLRERYLCPICQYESTKSCVQRHINKVHKIEGASTIEMVPIKKDNRE